ncbi:hypothetical protein OS914_11195 [Arthrobacter sp. H14-L1]|nr:hypothetical protein [Arthrobacter sp. H14-L1]
MLGYGLSILVSAAVTLLTIPIVIAHSGAADWGSLAVSQAIGSGAGVLIGFGWGTTGPTEVARADPDVRRRFYVHSLRARLVLVLPVALAAVIVTVLAAGHIPLEAGINAAGYSLTGLLAGWYFTGTAKPYSFLLFDTAPRVVGAALGAAALFFGAPLIVFPALQLIGVIFGILASTLKICGSQSRVLSEFRLRSTLEVLSSQSHGVLLAVVSASYTAVPTSIVAFAAPAALPAYALVDKLLRFGTTAYAPIVQFLQGWVPAGKPFEVRHKIRLAFLGGSILAGCGGGAFIVLAPELSKTLSHGQVAPQALLIVGFALALTFMVASQITGLVCLIALNRTKQLAMYTSVGVVVGLPFVYVGAVVLGAAGAAWALAFAELVALVPQIILLRISLRRVNSGREETATANFTPNKG